MGGNRISMSGGTINIGANSTTTVTGSNDNIVIGGSSTTTVNGNTETFVFHSGFGQDVINGVNSTDKIRFDHQLFADWAHVMAATTQSGSDTIITLDANDTITLKNVTASSLTQNQFQFA